MPLMRGVLVSHNTLNSLMTIKLFFTVETFTSLHHINYGVILEKYHLYKLSVLPFLQYYSHIESTVTNQTYL